MSTHSKLQNKKKPLENYKNEIFTLFNKIKFLNPEWNNKKLKPINTKSSRKLIILAGSQKGLCGNYNINLFYFFEKYFREENIKKIDLIGIGRKVTDYLSNKNIVTFKQYEEFNSTRITILSKEISNIIMDENNNYSSVIFYANFPKTFFTQKQKKYVIIPFHTNENNKIDGQNEYVWEEDPNEILNILAKEAICMNIQNILMQSLISEQAARFLAMDNSTRNAETLIEETTLKYNKIRQSQITKELTDLVSSYSED